MVEHDVDLLLSYLDSFPRLKKQFKYSPPRVFWRDRWRVVLGVRKLSSGLEIRCGGGCKLRLVPGSRIPYSRENQKQRLLTLIQTYFGPVQSRKVLDKTDRNRHQSEAILRVHLRAGDRSIVVLSVYENESPELSCRLLSSLVIWWDGLGGADLAAVFLPDRWSERILDLLPFLTIPVACYKYRLGTGAVRQIYPASDQLSSIRSPYVIYPLIREAPGLFVNLSGEYPSLDLLFRHGKWELSYKGLPVAWFDETGTALFDAQCPKRITRLSSLRAHICKVMNYRRYPPPFPGNFCFRFGEERWLESLILKNHRGIDSEFRQEIYSQVPTCVGGDRKVLDLLTATSQGRLAVMELKTHKCLSLLFQGLDYWERVDHHRLRGDFGSAGYFTEIDLVDATPLLYLVCPLFEFHPILVVIRHYLRKNFSIRCVGINSDWKRGLRILRRFEL